MRSLKLKLGILGYPLEHSLSPAMHTAALQQLNINGEYKTYEAQGSALENVFKQLKKEKINGLNVTVPYKKTIIPFLDELTNRAELIGAVNTIIFDGEGKALGDNTDVIGFWESIPEQFLDRLTNVSLVGCGGSAHAVVTPLLQYKLKSLKVYGRNKDKLEVFKSDVELIKEKVKSKASIEIDLIQNIDLSSSNVLINTTPVGMYPNINDSPVKKELLEKMSKDSLVYDIIYNPLETKLLKDAKSLGLHTINGVDMLVKQGAASLDIWFGKKIAPIEVMKNAVLDSLQITSGPR